MSNMRTIRVTGKGQIVNVNEYLSQVGTNI